MAAILDEISRGCEDLTFFGNAGCERGAIHDLAERIALCKRAKRQTQIEGTRCVAIGCEDGRVKEQTVLRRHFASLEGQQARRNVCWCDLELIGADHQRVALLRLRV